MDDIFRTAILLALHNVYQEFLVFISESSFPGNPYFFFLLTQNKYCYEHTETPVFPKHSACPKCTAVGPLSTDSKFAVAAWGVRKGSNSLVGWLTETWTKMWLHSEWVENANLPWFRVEERVQRLREIKMDLLRLIYSQGGSRRQLLPHGEK